MTTGCAGACSISGRQPDADERREIAARNRRRVRNRPIVRRELQIRKACLNRRDAPAQLGARLEVVRLAIHLERAGKVAARVEHLADPDPRRRIRRVHFDDALVPRERLVGLPLFRLDLGEIAHEKRAVRRRGNRLCVQARRFVQAVCLHGLAGVGHVVLLRARAQHLDASRDALKLRIELDRRFE